MSLWVVSEVKVRAAQFWEGHCIHANLKVENYFLYDVDSSKLCSSFFPLPPFSFSLSSFSLYSIFLCLLSYEHFIQDV